MGTCVGPGEGAVEGARPGRFPQVEVFRPTHFSMFILLFSCTRTSFHQAGASFCTPEPFVKQNVFMCLAELSRM